MAIEVWTIDDAFTARAAMGNDSAVHFMRFGHIDLLGGTLDNRKVPQQEDNNQSKSKLHHDASVL